MSSSKLQQQKNTSSAPPRSLKRALLLTGVIAGIVLLFLYFILRPDSADTISATTTSTKQENQSIKTDVPETKHLIGRWLRPDGGYILEIRSATPDGKIDAGYYNPNSINVGRAEWVVKDGKQYVLVELKDVNYPGSTYGLEYIVAEDRLSGTYYQAVEKSTYDVQFVRE